jgi:inner membrane protein
MSSQTGFDRFLNSQFTRIFIVSVLILFLQIPTVMLLGLVNSRQDVRQEAITDVTSKWGGAQTIIGPRLVVPYIRRYQSGKTTKTELQNATFLPEALKITSQMKTEVRYRGIFEVPVYKSNVDLRGQFLRPDFSTWGVRSEDILWDRAELSLQIADARAVQNQASLSWNQAKVPFAPGQGKFIGTQHPGIHARLKGQMTGERFTFAIPLELNGSEQIRFAPFGKVTQVTMDSNWRDPSFQGLWLPANRTVDQKGFKATWDIPSLGRNYDQQWNTDAPVSDDLIQRSVFGVDLLSTVDNYRMADRSIRYNFLFILLTFATLWLFEVVARLRVHPLQYLMVGAAMCLFYLLQLAISEHLGFYVAYTVASVAIVSMITAYSIAVLRAKKRGGIMGVMQASLYGYLYIVLASPDYSLLISSLGLFGFLAIVMFLTRRIDWFNPDANN